MFYLKNDFYTYHVIWSNKRNSSYCRVCTNEVHS